MSSKNLHVIGICGKARAGKSTFAGQLGHVLLDVCNEKYIDHIVALESFAAPIKSMTAMLLDFFGYGSIMNSSSLAPFIEGDRKEEELEYLGASARKIMQTLGTDWGRNLIDKNIWINCMDRRIDQYEEAEKHGHKGAFVLITDVRFDNEAEMIKHKGGTIVRITTDRELEDVADHASEAGVSDFLVDHTVENNEDIDELKVKATAFLEGYLGETIQTVAQDAPVIIQDSNKG